MGCDEYSSYHFASEIKSLPPHIYSIRSRWNHQPNSRSQPESARAERARNDARDRQSIGSQASQNESWFDQEK